MLTRFCYHTYVFLFFIFRTQALILQISQQGQITAQPAFDIVYVPKRRVGYLSGCLTFQTIRPSLFKMFTAVSELTGLTVRGSGSLHFISEYLRVVGRDTLGTDLVSSHSHLITSHKSMFGLIYIKKKISIAKKTSP